MKKFSEIKVGEEYCSTCSISGDELEKYVHFSRLKNVLLEDVSNSKQLISGRALLSRIEGEFTRLDQIYGNHIIYIGSDGDPSWGNRSVRFLKPFFIDEELKIKFTVSDKEDIDDEFGKITVDYEGVNQKGETVLLSKKNLYRIKK